MQPDFQTEAMKASRRMRRAKMISALLGLGILISWVVLYLIGLQASLGWPISVAVVVGDVMAWVILTLVLLKQAGKAPAGLGL